MVAPLLLFGIVITVAFIVIVLLLKKLEREKTKLAVNATTNEPIDRRVSMLKCFTNLFDKSQQGHELNYANAASFQFKNYLQFLAHIPLYTISNAADAKKVLLNWKDFPKTKFPTELTQALAGENMAFVNGEDWKRQHNIIAPAFMNIDRFAEVIERETRKCLDGFAKYGEGSNSSRTANIPLSEFTTAFTMDVLGSTILGYEFDMISDVVSQKKSDHSMSDFVPSFKYLVQEISNFASLIVPFYTKLPTERNRKVASSLAKVDEIVNRLVSKAKERRTTGYSGTQTLLDIMVDSVDTETGAKMTDKELRDNAVILLIAGHDTTSTALSFAMWLLARHQDVQAKLIDEIDRVLGSHHLQKEVDLEAIKGIEYVGWVIKETLRLHPPVVFVPMREVTKTETFGADKVKRGCKVSVSVYNIHHNPEHWEQPFEFRPERFSEQECKNRPLHAFIPFGGGARVCIGSNLSLLEQKIFLVSLLRRYTLELPADQQSLKLINTNSGLVMPDPSTRLILKHRI